MTAYHDEPFHPHTRALLAYGRAIARGQEPPSVRGTDQLGERLFVIDAIGDDRAFKMLTVGADLIALFGRELRGEDLFAPFLPPDRLLGAALVNAVLSANDPGVLCLTGDTACGRKLGLELVLTPLAKGVLTGRRLLGLMQPLGGEDFLHGKPLTRLRVNALYPPLAKAPPARMRLVVSNS